jgi:hypothetical protein
MVLQRRARRGFPLGEKLHLRKIAADISILTVGLVPVRMHARKKFVHDERGEECVNADHSRAVFVNAAQVTFPDQTAVHFRVRPAHRFGVNSFHIVHTTAEEAGKTRLQVMDRAGNTVDAACTVSVEPDTHIKIRHQIEGSEPVRDGAQRRA